MTWFVQLQQAHQLIADREVEARRDRLARLAAGQVPTDGRRQHVGVARRFAARLALVVGRFATRVAGAIDAETVRVA